METAVWEPPGGNWQGAQNQSKETLFTASELGVGTEHCSGSSEKGQARTRHEVRCQRLLGGAGPQDSRAHRRGSCGDPRNMPPCLLRVVPAVRPGGEEGSPLTPLPPLGGHLEASLSCPAPAVASLPQPPPILGSGGHRPYLSLQRHSPHGQAAHGLVCDFPPPHRQVIEGVGQLLGVLLRRDLKQGGWQRWSVPVGTWQ